MKQQAHLDNWTKHDNPNCLTGNVTGHPRFHGGQYIYTSTIVKMDEAGNKAETLNTHYTLGTKAH